MSPVVVVVEVVVDRLFALDDEASLFVTEFDFAVEAVYRPFGRATKCRTFKISVLIGMAHFQNKNYRSDWRPHKRWETCLSIDFLLNYRK